MKAKTLQHYEPSHDIEDLPAHAQQSHATKSIAGYVVYIDPTRDADTNTGVTRLTPQQYELTMDGVTHIGFNHVIGHINVRAPLDITSPEAELHNPNFFTSLIGPNSCQDTPENRKLHAEIMHIVNYIKKGSLGTGLLPSIAEAQANCALSKREWNKRSAVAKQLAFGPNAKPIEQDDPPISVDTKKAVAAEKKLLAQFRAQYLLGKAGEMFDTRTRVLPSLLYGWMLDLTKKLARPCTTPEMMEWSDLQVKLHKIKFCTPEENAALNVKAGEGDRIAHDIVCRKHGVFCQRSDDHISGHGCPNCPCKLCGGLCTKAISHAGSKVAHVHAHRIEMK